MKCTIIAKDSQSDPNRASEVARDLILNNNVDLMITSSTPETDNPVAVLCESEGSRASRRWCHGRPGTPASAATRVKPTQKFEYNVMFFFGLEGFGKCFIPMWDRIRPTRSSPRCSPTTPTAMPSGRRGPRSLKAAGYTPRRRGCLPGRDGQLHDHDLGLQVT